MREVDTVTNEDIRRALLSVRPDDAARERMLGHIRAAAALERVSDKIARFAREEGLEGHARSVLSRSQQEEET